MKRYISIILILLCFFVLNNLFAYTEKDAKNIGFELVLNKSGVNKIYYAKSASIDKDDNIVSTLLSNNRHIFPFLSSSTDTTLSDYLYFVWELDDASGATITLRFVSSDTDFNTGYMLQNVNNKFSSDSSKSNDFNYSVSVYKEADTANPIGSIIVNHDTVLSSKTLNERTIKVFDADNGDKSNSFVKIEMTVLAPLWNESDVDPAFMDAQYAGYIVAELKFN